MMNICGGVQTMLCEMSSARYLNSNSPCSFHIDLLFLNSFCNNPQCGDP